MLNNELFVLYQGAPEATWIPREHECSDRAWTFACECSYQNTYMDEDVWQDEILSIVENGAECTVTLGRQDGTIYQESINLDEWYGCDSIVG